MPILMTIEARLDRTSVAKLNLRSNNGTFKPDISARDVAACLTVETTTLVALLPPTALRTAKNVNYRHGSVV